MLQEVQVIDSPFSHRQIEQMQQEIIRLLRKSPNSLELLSEYFEILNNKIKLQEHMVENQVILTKTKGRGGNNTAENLKKMFIALAKRFLPPNIFNQFLTNCMKKYQLKSQKENIMIFFLYLYKLMLEGKIQNDLIQRLIKQTKLKINKYINNSRQKLDDPHEKRRQFHQKNIVEFQKFFSLNLDFNQQRSFKKICQNINILFLRKKKQFLKAADKLRSIILNEPLLKNIFHDLQIKQTSSNEQAFLGQKKQIQKQFAKDGQRLSSRFDDDLVQQEKIQRDLQAQMQEGVQLFELSEE